MHLVRAFGSFLWLWYAVLLGSMPLVVTELIAIVIDLIAAKKFNGA